MSFLFQFEKRTFYRTVTCYCKRIYFIYQNLYRNSICSKMRLQKKKRKLIIVNLLQK